MPTYLLTIAYDGLPYAGWQRQAGQDTVQERVERAAVQISGGPIHVEGAGRTDAGVHALAMAAHVVLPRVWEPGSLRLAMNANLPPDIAVQAVQPAPDGFHARFHAKGKRYVYRVVASPVRPAIARGYYHWVRRAVDLPAMRAAAALLRGRHDFASFATNPGYVRRHGTVRTLQRIHLVQRRHGFDLCVQGDGFLYNMVRTIAGTLLDVGLGRRSPAWVGDVLAAADRRRAGATAPAGGLYLLSVLYEPQLLPAEPAPPPGESRLPSTIAADQMAE
ncbi:MAG: tRNA pseudouridine(38-40) synthase TruA [Planctomycetes bacterium]|nr:tRNA pseudouridine(38-40) synthase TruA [Planctomycetota bacterium]